MAPPPSRLFELKNARRVMIEGGRTPWSTMEDVTFRFNVIRHAGSAINISGWDDLQASGQAQRIQIVNSVEFDVDTTRWGGSGIFVQIGNSPRNVAIERNTVVQSATVLNVYSAKGGAPWVIDGFAFRDNLVKHNLYGVKGDGLAVGQQTLSVFFSNLAFERTVLAGDSPAAYPAGNYFPTEAEFMAAFVNVAAEDYSLVGSTPFLTFASDGGAVGADVARVSAALNGAVAVTTAPGVAGVSSAPGAGGSSTTAVCRTPLECPAVSPFSHQR